MYARMYELDQTISTYECKKVHEDTSFKLLVHNSNELSLHGLYQMHAL